MERDIGEASTSAKVTGGCVVGAAPPVFGAVAGAVGAADPDALNERGPRDSR
jgi:hypothetical protein